MVWMYWYGTEMPCFLLLMLPYLKPQPVCGCQSLSSSLHPSIHPSLTPGSAALPNPLTRSFFFLSSVPPSVPVQLQVVWIQEVRWDPQWCESPSGTWWHGEVQPLHIVQAWIRQAHVERGRGRGRVTEGQVRRVHGRVGLLVHQLSLQLLHQALCAWVWHWWRISQGALQKGLQLIVCGQRGEAGQAVAGDGAQGGRRGHLDLWRWPGESGADGQGGDVRCDWESFSERHWRVRLDKGSDFWGGRKIQIYYEDYEGCLKS